MTSKFGAGDRVEYIGKYTPFLEGKVGTILEGRSTSGYRVHFDDEALNFPRPDGTRWYGCMSGNLILIPQLQYREDQPIIEDEDI